MSMSDPLGDMLTRIRNAQGAGKTQVTAPASKLRSNVLEVLKREGYIRDFRKEKDARGFDQVAIELKYPDGAPVSRQIARVAKPGWLVYSKIKDLPRSYNVLGMIILSTPRGVMSDHEARAANVGGEVLCRVF